MSNTDDTDDMTIGGLENKLDELSSENVKLRRELTTMNKAIRRRNNRIDRLVGEVKEVRSDGKVYSDAADHWLGMYEVLESMMSELLAALHEGKAVNLANFPEPIEDLVRDKLADRRADEDEPDQPEQGEQLVLGIDPAQSADPAYVKGVWVGRQGSVVQGSDRDFYRVTQPGPMPKLTYDDFVEMVDKFTPRTDEFGGATGYLTGIPVRFEMDDITKEYREAMKTAIEQANERIKNIVEPFLTSFFETFSAPRRYVATGDTSGQDRGPFHTKPGSFWPQSETDLTGKTVSQAILDQLNEKLRAKTPELPVLRGGEPVGTHGTDGGTPGVIVVCWRCEGRKNVTLDSVVDAMECPECDGLGTLFRADADGDSPFTEEDDTSHFSSKEYEG